jgi:hypothetical protein
MPDHASSFRIAIISKVLLDVLRISFDPKETFGRL